MLLMPFSSSNIMFKILLSSFKYLKIFTLNTTGMGNRLACVWLDITIAAKVDHVTDNLPPPTNSLFLLKIGDIFKVNWTHSDPSNLCPLRGDSKLILITIDLQTMALLLLWLHSCHYTGFMVQDAERPGNLWEVPGALPLGDPYPGLVSPLVRTWCSGHAGS